MSETLDQLLARTTASQRSAAAPGTSAWVAANAGSGKTKVLTDRVMRLLLAGHQPSKLLCITFTKAAAAEMADRLFKRLGSWALMDDAKLQEELQKLDDAPRTAQELSEARKLFARALETPGGLKIQTIHSFCESVLKRFPLETGISPGFSVMEEADATALIDTIIDTLAERLWRDGGEERDDFLLLTDRLQEEDIRRHISFLANRGREISEAIRVAGGLDVFFGQLAEYLGVDPEQGREVILTGLMTACEAWHGFIDASVDALDEGGKDDRTSSASLRAMRHCTDAETHFEAAKAFAFTKAGDLRKRLTNKAGQKAVPGVDKTLQDIAEAIQQASETLKGVEIFQSTRALYRLALFVYDAYEADKARRGMLDFDDLIARTAALFHDRAATWVLYKLDQGIDHLLVDEAQDTSGSQWSVIEGPLLEFFAGDGAREDERTVFVVGDEKQSIYSFQGADVGLFQSQQLRLNEIITTAERPFSVQELTVSFRSTAPVLGFVDELFTDALAASGVSELAPMRHQAARIGHAGHVELWPLVQKSDRPEIKPWDVPVDTPGQDDPPQVLARHIARTIKDWLEKDEMLAARGRPVRPSDVMILCQSRGRVFQEIVRALVNEGVPTAGSDRVKLMDHIAAQDMRSATRFALQQTDDLSLAEVLKSPLFGFSEVDLFTVAHGRGRRSLWHVLQDKDDEKSRAAVERLKEAIHTGRNRGPYAFYTQLLETGSPSGWKRFYARLGTGARDVLQELLSEALNFENGNPRSLQGFLAHLEALDTDLKKEIGGDEDLVRIMTVHGAKGLEAPIVFLADMGYANYAKISGPVPAGSLTGTAATTGYAPQPGCYYLLPSKEGDNDASAAARDHAIALRAEEYRRLLYVAATRAEDRLYLCGTLGGNIGLDKFLAKPGNECSWYALADAAFRRMTDNGTVAEGEEKPWGGRTLIFSSDQQEQPKDEDQHTAKPAVASPDWLSRPARKEQPPRMISPSTLGGSLERDSDAPAEEPAAYTPLAAPDTSGLTPFTRGNALHLLLERLPDVPPPDREAAASRLLIRNYPDLSAHFEGWAAEAMGVLTDPAFAPVFATGSRAEVPVMGSIEGVIISGQIDRLAIAGDRVLIVDYKTNRPPPERVEDAPQAYVTQLAAYRHLMQEIYKDHQVDCALLWTWVPRLMPIPAEMLDHALLHSLKLPDTAEKA
ncbi:double-strand break repair helicase AddA [Parvularcula flava]|uniref:DNA 3'-5' helicase n=1 Tax=Aquisalinus luteolus TaxID=1566827 RepID=A0A8J3A2F7_9PROT|nr:double-strand break repair helicase AddA [Aquisalinus luteolus]NHK28278.1 double-strand break repair helicase AddA [Aquisalinus luteolus]GGH98000.1 double-strand break repair helicase AddA [Aquisalinus luteolus]